MLGRLNARTLEKEDYAHFVSIDGLRGLSILMVVASHVFFRENIFVLRFFSGDFGVHIFFVISGFLITTLLLREKSRSGTISLTDFYIRRFLRIFPVAYLFLVVLFVLNKIFDLNINQSSFLGSALYLKNVSILHSSDWYTGHFWSLSVEEQFYLAFPFLFKKMDIKTYLVVLIILLFIIPVVHYASVHEWVNAFSFKILDELMRNMTGILIGSILAILLFYKIIYVSPTSHERTVYSILFFIGAATVHSNFIAFIPTSISVHLSSVLIAGLILINLNVNENNPVYKVLNSRVLSGIGVLSYSIYIWQQIFSHNMPWQHLFRGADTMLVNLVALMGVSFASYYYYERYFLELKKRYKRV